ncbi:hypothetical protein Tco_0120754, partial [Tanacetum coccineum]
DDIKDSDAEESSVADSKAKGGEVGCFSDTRKRKRGEVWEQNRVLAGFGIGGKKVYTSWVVTEGDLKVFISFIRSSIKFITAELSCGHHAFSGQSYSSYVSRSQYALCSKQIGRWQALPLKPVIMEVRQGVFWDLDHIVASLRMSWLLSPKKISTLSREYCDPPQNRPEMFSPMTLPQRLAPKAKSLASKPFGELSFSQKGVVDLIDACTEISARAKHSSISGKSHVPRYLSCVVLKAVYEHRSKLRHVDRRASAECSASNAGARIGVSDCREVELLTISFQFSNIGDYSELDLSQSRGILLESNRMWAWWVLFVMSEELLVLDKLVLLLESKNEVCLLCEGNLKQIPAFDFFCASVETISAIEETWERRGIANMAFIQLGGSRVDEMILARERSGFAGKKYGATYKL